MAKRQSSEDGSRPRQHRPLVLLAIPVDGPGQQLGRGGDLDIAIRSIGHTGQRLLSAGLGRRCIVAATNHLNRLLGAQTHLGQLSQAHLHLLKLIVSLQQLGSHLCHIKGLHLLHHSVKTEAV